MYRYYSTERPLSIGTYPKPKDNKPVNIENFDLKTYIPEIKCEAYGYIEYENKLTDKQIADYELKEPLKTAYIAGKITCNKNYKEEFQKAEEYLKSQGYIVMNPAILNSGFEQKDYLHVCMAMIDTCEIVFFLPNWINSPGAKKEMKYSRWNNKEIQFLKEEV